MNDTNEVLAFHADIAVGLSPYADSLIEHIKALQSRLESLEKDAARYRWMKEHDMTGLRIYKSCRTPEEIETAIDAAMKG